MKSAELVAYDFLMEPAAPTPFYRRPIVITIVFLLLGAGAYIAAHALRPMGEPRFTVEMYPPVPDNAENAYALAAAYRGSPPDVSLGESLPTDAGAAPEPAAPATPDAAVDTMLTAVASDLQAMRDRARFVDTCVPTWNGECPGLMVVRFSKLRGASVAQASRQGEHRLALERALVDWRHAADFGGSCRSLVSCAIALHTRWTALHAAERAVQALPEAADAETLAAFDALLGGLDEPPPSLSLDVGLIGEYLITRPLLEDFPERGLLMDISHTDTLYADLLEEMQAYARDPSASGPTLTRFTEQPLWWAYNAGGKRMLDDVMMSFDLVDRIRHRDAQVEPVRVRAVALMGSARPALAAPPTPTDVAADEGE